MARIGFGDVVTFAWLALCLIFPGWSTCAVTIETNEATQSLNPRHSNQVDRQLGGEEEEYIYEKEELRNLHQEAGLLLQQHASNMENLDALNRQGSELLAESTELYELEQSIAARAKKVNNLIRTVNAIQMEFVASQLNETVTKEIQTRSAMVVAQTIERKDETVVSPLFDLKSSVTLSELQTRMDPTRVFQESSASELLEEWILQIVEDELPRLLQQHETKAANELETVQKLSREGSCLKPMEAAHIVQESILKHKYQDGIGLMDHTQQKHGASIVHALTSRTFEPPQRGQNLGNVWWRRYIPEDWENHLLPGGWHDWSTVFPPSLQRLLGQSATTLPPEAIFDPRLIPGACWPMEGPKGYVTIRLPYPVVVGAVTIDHVPSSLVRHDHQQQQQNEAKSEVTVGSAPKQIRIIGYPPCSEQCQGLGFDVTKGLELGTVTYEINGRAIQTFHLVEEKEILAATTKENYVDGNDANEDDRDEASCSVTQTSCSAPNHDDAPAMGVPVIGIRFEVMDNWGMNDYTCLYRIRVHGEVV